MSIFRNIAGALGGNSNVSSGIINRLGLRGGQKTSAGYMSASDLQASQDREGARRAQRAEEIKSFIASKQTTQPEVSSATNSLLVPDSKRMTTRQGMNNFILSTGRGFESLGNLNTRQNIAPRELTSFQQKTLMNPDGNTFDTSSQLTNVPPPSSSLVQPFAQPVQRSANQIFGDLFARQNAVGAPMMFKINK